MGDARGETVLVLGAGFSRAIAEAMPLTDELGNLALKRAGFDERDWWATGWTFESWLSRLAEDQPDLDEAENLLNRSRFASLLASIGEVICERQDAAFETSAPDWLGRLVAVLHAERCTAISFNYDTLVEAAVMAHLLTDWRSDQRAKDVDVIGHLPPHPPSTWGAKVVDSFQLVKLHGSVDWWWSPGDATAATINRWPMRAGFGIPGCEDSEERRRRLPGRSRFIIPPTATKSAYYTNPFTRELWRRAAEALGRARDVYLVGYSLPETDLVVAGMFRHWVTDARITVVNPCCAPIEGRLLRLAYEPHQVARIESPRCLEDLVEMLELQASRRVLEQLHGLSDLSAPVCVAFSESVGAVATELRRSGSVLKVVLEARPQRPSPFGMRDESAASPVVAHELVEALSGVEALEAELPDGSLCRIIDTAEMRQAIGHSNVWRVLVPACLPPRQE